MQLSLSSDYACRVLIFLCVKEKSSVAEIAERFKISANHLVKVVHRLGALGYLKTTRGKGGGISLGKDPHKITVGEIVRKMEPHLDLVECFNVKKDGCIITGACGLKHLLHDATDAFLQKLDACTFGQIASQKQSLSRLLVSTSKKSTSETVSKPS